MKESQKRKIYLEHQNTEKNFAINLRNPEKLIMNAEENRACYDCLTETFVFSIRCLIVKFGNIFDIFVCIFDFIEEDCLDCICSFFGINCPENMKDSIQLLGQSLKNKSFYGTQIKNSCSNFDTDYIVDKCRNSDDFEQCFIDEIEKLSDNCATCFCEKLGIDC